MPPRKKEIWSLERIKAGLQRFYTEYGHYPVATEIDNCEYLPSSRQIQRKYGGLPALRETLKLGGQLDYTKGEHSSIRATNIGKRAHQIEHKVYTYLVQRFGRPYVHREYFFTDDKRTRADFYVYGKKGNFMVDVFYPKDKHNMIGCLTNKFKTYQAIAKVTADKVIFLMMNDEISEGDIQAHLMRRKNQFYPHQKVMTYAQFMEYSKTVEPRSDNTA